MTDIVINFNSNNSFSIHQWQFSYFIKAVGTFLITGESLAANVDLERVKGRALK